MLQKKISIIFRLIRKKATVEIIRFDETIEILTKCGLCGFSY